MDNGKLYEAVGLGGMLFQPAQLDNLRREWATLNRIDPQGETYLALIDYLDRMPQSILCQLRDANIRFVSLLAANRVKP